MTRFFNKGDASLLIIAIILAGIFLTGIFSPFYTDIPFIPTSTPALSPTPTSSSGLSCLLPIPNDIPTIQSSLKKNYGINLIGSQLGLSDGLKKAQDAFTALCLLAKSPDFMKNLGSLTNNITVNIADPTKGDCAGHSDYATGIVMSGFKCFGINNIFLLIHELGHQIAFRNPNIYNKYLTQVYNGGSGALPTWNCQLDYGPGPWPGECFADMIGEYVVWTKLKYTNIYTTTVPFPEFTTTYSKYYAFARDNIFGKIEYINTTGTNTPSGGNYCSTNYLANFFGSQQIGQQATCICKMESGGNPFALNDNCLRGGTADYSLGLFQINLLAHCSNAIGYQGNVCVIKNQTTFNQCKKMYFDPVQNIQKAVELYRGQSWQPWTNSAIKCNLPH